MERSFGLITLFAALIVVLYRGVACPFCFEEAGQYYAISPDLLQAIARVESNMRPGAVGRNKDGSMDYCHMQINSYWKKHLKGRWRYLSDPCYCTMVGAWILRQCVDRYGYNWNAVACYHAGRSLPELPPGRRVKAIRYIRHVSRFLNGGW